MKIGDKVRFRTLPAEIIGFGRAGRVRLRVTRPDGTTYVASVAPVGIRDESGKIPPISNPFAFAVYARRRGRKGELMWFDGKKLTNNNRAKLYGSKPRARAAAVSLMLKYKVLSDYQLYVGPPPRLRNPQSLDAAADKLERFTGFPARNVIKVRAPKGGSGMVVGEIRHLSYVTRREGIAGSKPAEYEHEFRKNSRPLLAVTTDGKQLHIVGGRYEFTDAGIEDR